MHRSLEICRRLEDDPTTRGIMILLVATLNSLADIERAVAAGIDDFLSKPVSKKERVRKEYQSGCALA